MQVSRELKKAEEDYLGHPPISQNSSNSEVIDDRWAWYGEEGTG